MQGRPERGLRLTFLVHAVVAALVGLQHLVAPRLWTELAGIEIDETATWRLIGAALVALAVGSGMAARKRSWPEVAILVDVVIVWSLLGAGVIAWAIVVEGLPALEWINAATLAVFACAFATFAVRARTARHPASPSQA